MTLNDIERMFNRAFRHCLSVKKFCFLGLILALCGLVLVFFRTFGALMGKWGQLSFTFLPLFLTSGLCLAAGVILTRMYQKEMNQEPFNFKELFKDSFEIIMVSSSISLPLLLAFLLLWVCMGVFFLLKEIPFFGQFFSIFLSFVPFLLFFLIIALFISVIVMFFFATPLLSLHARKGLRALANQLLKRMTSNCFRNVLLIIIALTPLLFILALLGLTVAFTKLTDTTLHTLFQSSMLNFFIMLPFVFILTPAINFFFNFALEVSHYFATQEEKVLK